MRLKPVHIACALAGAVALAAIPASAADVTGGAGDAWAQLMGYIRTQQVAFHRELSGAVRALRDGGILAAWTLVAISFLYGVFHAAGPGHGKAIISTYLVTHESKLKQGIFLALASAFVQGISAILVVFVLIGIVGWSARDAQGAVTPLEAVSFGLVALIGAVLSWRSAKGLAQRMRQPATMTAPAHVHDHNHHNHEFALDTHGGCGSCGHAHAPDPSQLDGTTGWRDTASIVLSVGIRPCSGSVLVLIFAELLGLRWAGVLAVFAVSFGTGLMVSLLATLSVYARKVAFAIGRGSGSATLQLASNALGLAGGLLIVALGLSLLNTTLATDHPLF